VCRCPSAYFNFNFYFVVTLRDLQLLGSRISDLSECTPLERNGELALSPCGLIANTLFNDVITVTSGQAMVDAGIAWATVRAPALLLRSLGLCVCARLYMCPPLSQSAQTRRHVHVCLCLNVHVRVHLRLCTLPAWSFARPTALCTPCTAAVLNTTTAITTHTSFGHLLTRSQDHDKFKQPEGFVTAPCATGGDCAACLQSAHDAESAYSGCGVATDSEGVAQAYWYPDEETMQVRYANACTGVL
jgi:LEM3 (ligand-effect modulator 3) family / CDC50 family